MQSARSRWFQMLPLPLCACRSGSRTVVPSGGGRRKPTNLPCRSSWMVKVWFHCPMVPHTQPLQPIRSTAPTCQCLMELQPLHPTSPPIVLCWWPQWLQSLQVFLQAPSWWPSNNSLCFITLQTTHRHKPRTLADNHTQLPGVLPTISLSFRVQHVWRSPILLPSQPPRLCAQLLTLSPPPTLGEVETAM